LDYSSSNKTLTLLLYRRQSGSPNSNSSHRKRYWKEAVTTTIGSGIATAVAAAMGGNSSGDFNNVFGEEKPSFAVGEGSDTGRRPLRRRLEVARRRFRVAVTATTRAARSQWCVLEETSFTKWGERVSDFLKFNPWTYRRTNPSVIRR